mgnify:CR=1 FL=1
MPRDVLERLGLEGGARVLLLRIGDSIILQGIDDISPERCSPSLEAIRSKARELRITRKDVEAETRGAKQKTGHTLYADPR